MPAGARNSPGMPDIYGINPSSYIHPFVLYTPELFELPGLPHFLMNMASNGSAITAPRNLAPLFGFLNQDDRPTFVLDADSDSEHSEAPQPSQFVYANPAIYTFLDELAADSTDGEGYDSRSFMHRATGPDLRRKFGIDSNFVAFGSREWKNSLLSGKWQVFYR